MSTNETPSVRTVFENKVKATKSLHRRPDETPSQHRVRVEATVAKEWGCAVSTFRAYWNKRRRPTLAHENFAADLKKYGRAEFDEKGRLIRESLDRGPEMVSFLKYTPAGSDRPRP
jgi:hypothetical protein